MFVYFDVGGVALFDFSDNSKWQEMAHDLGVKEDQFSVFRNIFKRKEDALCGGQAHYEHTTQLLREELALDISEDYDMLTDFVSRFERNQSIHPVIEAIKAVYPVGLLTNMYPDMLPRIFKSDLLPTVEWEVVVDSSEVGCSKPEPKIYELAEDRCGYKGEEILFIDNLEENLEIPRERGWHTILYDGSDLSASNQKIKTVLNL